MNALLEIAENMLGKEKTDAKEETDDPYMVVSSEEEMDDLSLAEALQSQK